MHQRIDAALGAAERKSQGKRRQRGLFIGVRRWPLTAAIVVTALAVLSAMAPTAAVSAPSLRGRYIVVLDDAVTDPAAMATEAGRRLGFRAAHVYSDALKGYVALMSASSADALEANPDVALVVQDTVVAHLPPSASPQRLRCEDLTPEDGDIQCVDDWVDRVDAERSSTRSGDGRGRIRVNVAVIDSGIDASHPDLNVAGGVNCGSGAPVREALPVDTFGHGTFVAGVIGARDDAIGVVGAAPGTPLWSVRLTNEATDEIRMSSVVCAVDWVTSTRTDGDASNDIQVANMSIGEDGFDDGKCGRRNHDPVHLAICHSVAAGTTYAVSAGNEATDFAVQTPASYNEVLTVTAMSDFDGKPGGRAAPVCYGQDLAPFDVRDDKVTTFSNYATRSPDKRHTISAPGDCISSTLPAGHWGVSSGTSFASPVVAGTTALCIYSGRCHRGMPRATMARIVKDARHYNRRHPKYGYQGDPLRPRHGRYYGWLINTGTY